MKVMYWPNEPVESRPERWQVGPRNAFQAARSAGLISGLSIFRYHQALADAGSVERFVSVALERVRHFAPDVLYVQHVAGTDLPSAFWHRIKFENPNMIMAYQELDVFGKYVKKLDDSVKAAVAHSDLVLVCGLQPLMELFARVTRAPVRYVPHSFDTERFMRHDPSLATKMSDLVMIGNRGTLRRFPLLYMPGGRRRAELAWKLSARHGAQFALYGSGWDDLSNARGPVDFLRQEETIQAGRISVNWDHYDQIAYYFSDRLPISLAAGVPHVTSAHDGYGYVFRNCPGLYACESVRDAVECCEWLISRPDSELLDEGMGAREWVSAHLDAESVYSGALRMCLERWITLRKPD